MTIIMWLFDKEEYHIYLDNDILRTMQTAHRSDNRGRSRKNLRTAIKKLLNDVTAEDPEKNHGSPINLDGDDQIAWPIIREYMDSLKKKATVDRNLAQKYKAGGRRNRGGGGNQQNNASSTAEHASPAGLAGSRDDMVEVLISQSLSSYKAVRSALMYLYKRAGVVANEDLKAKMAQFIAGCKRTIQTEKQELAQKISEGKEPKSVETFEYIAKELFVSESAELAVFAHLFFLLDWNLTKRAENCEGCKIDHIYWSADSLVFEFAKSKGDQDGKFVGPWHCYSNPESPHLCVVLALANYCLTYQEVLIRGAPLFEGMSQYDRYAKAFRVFTSTHAERLRDLGVKPGDLGTHSSRKGVATMVAAGCTVLPPIVSLCIRVGWIMGGLKDKYLFYESAGDHYIGRCTTTINRVKKEFAVSPAYFDLSNIEDPIKREEKREEIHDFLFSRIGDLSNVERTRKMIVMAFAAVCYHSKYIDENMHPRNPFRATTIWKDLQPEITSYARIAYPWDQTSDTPSFTGIPPHVTLLADIAELKREMQTICNRFE